MKNFWITKSTDPELEKKEFQADTTIRQDVYIPYTDDIYRCVMFDGITIRLISGEKIIEGVVY